MSSARLLVALALALLFATLAARAPARADAELPQEKNPWFASGQKWLAEAREREPIDGPAKNVILVIGDGMDVSTITAARILDGQLRGEPGEENFLAFERFPHTALVKTYNTDQQVADSAGTATAILSGVKTQAGVIGVDEKVVRGDCASAKAHAVTSALELAERAGMSTGVITTARLTHATPGSAYAHAPERAWESDADLPAKAREEGCRDVARQLVEFAEGDGIEVALGGGRDQFLPAVRGAPRGERGIREDGRNLAKAWTERHPKSAYVKNRAELLAIDPKETDHLLGLFTPSHMAFEADRQGGDTGEPSLSEMTARALDILEKNPKGYLLVVEGGRIDHAHHVTDARRALLDTRELAKTAGMLAERTDPEDTLLLVTSDHAHTLSISGYPARGNPIFGKVVEPDASGKPSRHPARADDGMPFTTLGYANGPNAPGRDGREDLSSVDTASPSFRQPAGVPMEMETHGGQDVPVFARGPLAHLLGGTIEQNDLFHLIAAAAELREKR
ncbi:MAG: alkaline phosphatase [Deltaproteobacteria bacterium]|nr:alkaline phosphatase [Deltaproteobacteria bacterium]